MLITYVSNLKNVDNLPQLKEVINIGHKVINIYSKLSTKLLTLLTLLTS
jgi:hypothetical protein